MASLVSAARSALHRLSSSSTLGFRLRHQNVQLLRRPPSLPLTLGSRQGFSSHALRRARYERFGNRTWEGGSGGSSGSGGGGGGGWSTSFGTLDRRTLIVGGIVGGGGLYYVFHLEKVPETGRWRFMDVSASTERHLAKESHDQLAQEFGNKILPHHHPVTRSVRSVVQNLLTSSDLGTLESPMSTIGDQFGFEPPSAQASSSNRGTTTWNLIVVDDPKIVNAMATWGSIVVFTGLLPVTGGTDGLAAVIGHEIAHATLRHPSERLSSMKVLAVLGILLQALGLDFGVSGLLTRLALELPNSRKQELEADKVGMMYAAKACFEPRAAAEVQHRLDALEKKSSSSSFNLDVGFLRTHPRGSDRVRLLESSLAEAYAAQAASPRCSGLGDTFGQFREAVPVFSERW